MSGLTNSKDVVDERILSLVRCFLNKNVDNFKVSVQPASKLGENWLGLLSHLTIEDVDDAKTKLHLVAKVAPHQLAYREFFPIRDVYLRETYVYNTIIPEFQRLQEKANLPEMFSPFAKVYEITTEELREGVLMEDMKKKGFKVYDHHINIDYPHALLAMKALGKWHALSFAMRDQNPETFVHVLSNCQESFFVHVLEFFVTIITRLGNVVLKAYDPVKDRKHHEALHNAITNASDAIKRVFSLKTNEKYAVINHGDFEVRNILYKYEDSSNPNLPTDISIIDWQLSRAGSPALDILFLIFVCSDKSFRQRHYLDLLHEYYHSFSLFLRQLGSDPDVLFPFTVLQNHLKQFSPFGLYIAIWVISLNIKESHDIPDLYNSITVDAIVEEFCSTANDEYIRKVQGVVSDFLDYGYTF